MMTLRSILLLKCPVCGKGKLFRGYFDNPDRCPECGYYFMRENGYFLPHVPIGYAATVIVSLGSWPVLRYLFGLESFWWTAGILAAVALAFGTWSVRYAKMLWLALDLTIHPPVAEDFKERGREVRDQ